MFGSNFIEIGIGMTLLFLLLSLMCSIASEVVARRLSWRAEMLQQGIRELIQDPVVADQVYRHPLIRSLGRKIPESALMRWIRRVPPLARWIDRRVDAWSKPSYIPSQIFARALLDVILFMPRVRPCDSLCEAIRGHTNEEIKILLDRIKAAELDELEPFTTMLAAVEASIKRLERDEAARKALLERVDAAKASAEAAADPGSPLIDRLHGAVNTLESGDLRRALRVLLERGEIKEVTEARAAIARWFDDGMDRVSGWYKQKSQRLVFTVALLMTVGLNIDTLLIADRLARDTTLRALVVAAGDGVPEQISDLRPLANPTFYPSSPQAPGVDINPSGTVPNPTTPGAGFPVDPPTPGSPAAVNPPTPGAASSGLTVPMEGPPAPGGTPASPPNPTGLGSNPGVTVAPSAAGADPAESLTASLARYRRLKGELDKLHLPIGWPTAEERERAAAQKAEREQVALVTAAREKAAVARAELAAAERASREKSARELALGPDKALADKAIAEAQRAVADAERAKADAAAARKEAALAREEEAIAAREAANERGWPSDRVRQAMRVFGWLFTALAASLGAQFWFDVLGKFMNLRIAGKKPEKVAR